MITPKNLPIHEIIGLEAEVAGSQNISLAGLRGTIIYETRNTFLVRTCCGDKMVPKNGNLWRFSLDGEDHTICGCRLLGRPYERLVAR